MKKTKPNTHTNEWANPMLVDLSTVYYTVLVITVFNTLKYFLPKGERIT